MRILNAMKVKILVTLLAFILAGGPALFAASAAKQLEKGKELYAQNKARIIFCKDKKKSLKI